MIDPRDPDYAYKRADEMLDALINRLASEAAVPVTTLHRVLLDKAHVLMAAAVEVEEFYCECEGEGEGECDDAD